MEFQTLELELHEGVALVRLNRPRQANALDDAMWRELRAALHWCDSTAEVRAVVLAGNGKHFAPASTCPCWPAFRRDWPIPAKGANARSCVS